MINLLNDLLENAKICFAKCQTINDLEQEKAQFLGKNGQIVTLLKGLATLDIETKKTQGAYINQTKKALEDVLEQHKKRIQHQLLQQKLNQEIIDVTLAGRKQTFGSLHPVMITQQRIEKIFNSMGFSVVDGPEIETDWFNFSALNSPLNHPARSMQDTFYINMQDDEQQDLLLRTHTSPIQVRYAQQHVAQHGQDNMPDIRIIAPGRTYRVDSDATHSPMFNQVEGLWIGKNVSFSDLKTVYTQFLKVFFENDAIEVRFRPSYFPFTEPSAEIDIAFSRNNGEQKWLEISGAGQVHPRVLQNMHIDNNQYMGFAFGSGLERLTMIKYGISDLRLFFEGDICFSQQFNGIYS
jgi:phenylalanyl-tRNA synthetase alpha chain